MTSLYTPTANSELDQKLTALAERQKPAPVEELFYEAPQTTALSVTPTTPGESFDLSQIKTLGQLRGLTSKTNKVTLPVCRFTHKGKTAKVVQLDSTLLAPARKLLLSRNFKKEYREQLDDIIYNQEKELNPDSLMAVAMMFNVGKSTDSSILLKSQTYVRLLPTICEVLNAFFKNNQSLIDNISYMIQDQIRPEVTAST